MRIPLMKKCSVELDIMRKFEADSKPYPQTNKLVSSAFKNINEIVYKKYCMEIQISSLLHKKPDLQDQSQVPPLSTQLRKS
jgi:hypothetical protein